MQWSAPSSLANLDLFRHSGVMGGVAVISSFSFNVGLYMCRA
jgi:hypothetical protein